MRFVIIKHEACGQKYLFKVLGGKLLKAGDLVLVETKKGKARGVCMCDSFEPRDDAVAAEISEAFGVKEPTASVIGIYYLDQWGSGVASEDTNEETEVTL